MLYPGISPASGAFGSRYVSAGCALSDVAARGAGIRGSFRAHRGAVAPHPQDPSSLSPLAFRRYTSAVRAGCANERQSGSVRGALGNQRPSRDFNQPFGFHNPFPYTKPREAAQDAAELCRLANSLNRLNEIACNCGLTERQERRKQNLQTRINVVLERAGFIAASGVDTQEYFDRVVWQRRPVWVSDRFLFPTEKRLSLHVSSCLFVSSN